MKANMPIAKCVCPRIILTSLKGKGRALQIEMYPSKGDYQCKSSMADNIIMI